MANTNLNSEKAGLSAAEAAFENTIRPSQISDFSGQDQIIENLRIFIKAAKMYCFMARPVWEKQPFPVLWPMNSE
jgi:Holliday junction resolvasome RuvABC ATP-dependent DNA helicase subunit